MKVSYRWLKEWVDFPWSPQELAANLTMVGLEVESLEEIKVSFGGVVVSRIQTIEKHPAADNLSLCLVNTGQESFKIVCGAKNMAPGDKVPLALPGTKLAGGMIIEKAEVRGALSEGMLCSEKELGLSEDQTGLMLLEPASPLGEPLDKVLDLQDWVLEVGITPNRGDCLSVIGIAREAAAVANLPLNFPAYRMAEMGPPISELTSVVIKDLELCPRYACRVLLDIKIGPSPWWLRRRLSVMGMRPINNIVDVTNYVMLELGQPLHAFDYDLLKENRIIVRRASPGEKLVTLDKVERPLTPEMLMIADAQEPVAVGGVMGGGASEVHPQTRRVLLESAYFNPTSIRKTSKALGLASEASYRFERGVDPAGTMRACNRATALMNLLAGGQIARGYIDEGVSTWKETRVPLRIKRTNAFLGINLRSSEQAQILRRLQLEVTPKGRGQLTVKVPTWRPDLSREADLWEEIARYYGYDRIPSTLPPLDFQNTSAGVGVQNFEPLLEDNLRRLLVAFGFAENISFSFTNPKVFAKLGLTGSHPEGVRPKGENPLTNCLPLKNPLNEEEGYLRTLLLPHLLTAAGRNLRLNQKGVKFFEIARTFHPQLGVGVQNFEPLPQERRQLLALMAGESREKDWAEQEARKADFYDLKGVLEGCAEALNLDWELVPVAGEKEGAVLSYMNPGRSLTIRQEGKALGFMGELKKTVAEAFDIAKEVYILELDLGAVRFSPETAAAYQPLPRYPAVLRDVALLVPKRLTAQELLGRFKRLGGELLEEVRVFDLYQGPSIPAGKKSLGLSLQYRAADRTLRDEEVNQYHAGLLEAVIKETGAIPRI